MADEHNATYLIQRMRNTGNGDCVMAKYPRSFS